MSAPVSEALAKNVRFDVASFDREQSALILAALLATTLIGFGVRGALLGRFRDEETLQRGATRLIGMWARQYFTWMMQPIVSVLKAIRVPASVVTLLSIPLAIGSGAAISEVSGYPSHLQSLLGAQYLVENFGVSGATVLLDSWRPYMDQSEFQSAKEFQPDIIVIILGTNDGLQGLHQYNESFKEDYSKLIEQFRQLESEPQIWVVKPPPIFSNSSDLSSTYFEQTIIAHIEEVANKHNPI